MRMSIAEVKLMIGAGASLGLVVGALVVPQWLPLMALAALGVAGVAAVAWAMEHSH
jgi:hypothetical protein